MGQRFGSPTGKQTEKLVPFLCWYCCGFLVEQIGIVVGCLAEHFGLSVAGGLGTLDTLVGSSPCLVGHWTLLKL